MNDRMKELDSLRGIAALVVIAFHTLKRSAYFTTNPFLHFIADLSSVGWAGVDMFFTLSGFLITGILLRTRDHPHYFKNFYARRALRILPVYFFLIAVVIFLIPGVEESFLEEIPQILPVMLVFQQNWVPMFFYFPLTMYLVITWSLAIEEQFYFLWPLIVRKISRASLIKFSAGYVAASIVARAAGLAFVEKVGKADIHRFFYFMPFSRFEELLIGALLAILLVDGRWQDVIKKYSLPVFFVSFFAFIALVIASPVSSSPLFGYPPMTLFGYTLISLFTVGLIGAFATQPETAPVRRLFQNRVLYFFGAYSYSMYLFHPIVTDLALNWLWRAKFRGAEIYALHAFITFGGTLLIALFTWHVIEKRALSLKKYFEY